MTKNFIVIVGDYKEEYFGHSNIYRMLEYSNVLKNNDLSIKWLNTKDIKYSSDLINNAKGIWFAPGTPYLYGEDVINLMRFTRENNIPTLGTCGGSQYLLIEYAKNVLNIKEATSEELDKYSTQQVICKLPQSLVGKTECLNIQSQKSVFYDIYNKFEIEEKYDCNYGFNIEYQQIFKENAMFPFSILNNNKELRGFQIKNHPFYCGVLFIPQINENYTIHPLINYFINVCYPKY